LKGVFTDFNNYFPDNMFMMGSDEVRTACYNESTNMNSFMSQKNLNTLQDVFQYHVDTTKNLLLSVNPNKTALYWCNEATLDLKHSKDDVLLYWGGYTNMPNLTTFYPDNKYVMALDDHYYLDCGRGDKFGGLGCHPWRTWYNIYSLEPEEHFQASSVLGGQVSAWSELFHDSNLLANLWPRAAALTDKYWG
jgi:Glycosyl hydrolase family 20, catalytic domain